MVENLSNFPGFIHGIAGMELGVNIFQQAQSEGAQFTMARLKKLQRADDVFHGMDANGQAYTATTAIIATGRVPIRLPLTKAKLKGVHFCSVCDGPLYRNRKAILAVVGSDNAAAQHALSLARIADKVCLIYRGAETKMDAAHADRLARQKNIEIHKKTTVISYKGLDTIEALEVQSGTGKTHEIPVDGVFLAIGWRPNTEFLDFHLEKTPEGYLKTDLTLMTSLPGLFAAGDVRDTDLWQVLTACADGARAAKHAAEHIAKLTTI